MRRFFVLALLVACRGAGSGPYETPGEGKRDTVRAQELSGGGRPDPLRPRAGAGAPEGRPDRRHLLRPRAQNNLGVLHFEPVRLYEAAREFEWARKLMPGHPDPKMNLALTLEQAGKTDEAIQTYETALEAWPGHVPTIQALALLTVTRNRESPHLPAWLETIAI